MTRELTESQLIDKCMHAVLSLTFLYQNKMMIKNCIGAT